MPAPSLFVPKFGSPAASASWTSGMMFTLLLVVIAAQLAIKAVNNPDLSRPPA
jgi:hypothetical protein